MPKVSVKPLPNLQIGDLVYRPFLVESTRTKRVGEGADETKRYLYKEYPQNPLILFSENKDKTMSSNQEYIKAYLQATIDKLKKDGIPTEEILEEGQNFFSSFF